MLGFGLQHLYPVIKDRLEVDISDIAPVMKGLDRIIVHACETLELSHAIRVIVKQEGNVLVSKSVPSWDDVDEQESMYMLKILTKGSRVAAFPCYMSDYYLKYYGKHFRPIHWITPPQSSTVTTQEVPRYGNEHYDETVYAHFALVVGVGPVGARNQFGEIPPNTPRANTQEDEDGDSD
jgi:hypothetical protein